MKGNVREGEQGASNSSDVPIKDDLPPGSEVGEYIIAGLLSRGGCGSVYQGAHRGKSTRGAIKVMHGALAAQPKMVERFLREIELVNLLRHPHIVEIHEFGVLPDE